MIFIIGLPRSGTTLLRAILSQHDRVFSVIETEEKNADLLDRPDKFYQEIHDLPQDRIPLYKLNTPMFLNFEKAEKDKKVFLVRDGRDSCLSYWLLVQGKSETTFQTICRYWRDVVSYMLDLMEKHSNIKLVKYETLVADPEKAVRDICVFTGLKYTKKMLEFHKNPGIAIPAGQEDWHQNLKIAVTQDRVGRHKKEMTGEQLEIFMSLNKSLLERLGYTGE